MRNRETKLIVAMLLLTIVVCVGLFLFVNHAQGAIVFENRVDTGETIHFITVDETYNDAATFYQALYNMDANYTLYLVNKTGVTGTFALTNFQNKPQIGENKSLQNSEFYLQIYGWSGFTSATVRITGYYQNFTAFTRDIVVTGDGRYNILGDVFLAGEGNGGIGQFRYSVTSVTGTGSFNFYVNQTQFNVIEKYGNNRYMINNAQLRLYNSSGTRFFVNMSGNLDYYYSTNSYIEPVCFYSKYCNFSMSNVTWNMYKLSGTVYPGNIYSSNWSMVDCVFTGDGVFISSSSYFSVEKDTCKMNVDRCFFNKIGVINGNYSFLNNTMTSNLGLTSVALSGQFDSVDNFYGAFCGYGIFSASFIDAKRITVLYSKQYDFVTGGTYTVYGASFGNMRIWKALTGTVSFRNSTYDSLFVADLTFFGEIRFQNPLYLHVVDNNTNTPLVGISVEIYNRTNVLVYSGSTDSNGDILFQWLNDTVCLNGERYFSLHTPHYVRFINTTGAYFNENITVNMSSPRSLIVGLTPIPTPTIVEYNNLVDCVGSTGHSWNPLLNILSEWHNYTGTGGGSGLVFLMDNPNPANGTCEGYNNISRNPSGLKTGVELTNNNFSDSTAYLRENNTLNDNSAPGVSGCIVAAQKVTINNSYVITKIGGKYYRAGDDTEGTMYVSIQRNSTIGLPDGINLTQGSISRLIIPPLEADAAWFNVSISPYVLSPGVYWIVWTAPDLPGTANFEVRTQQLAGEYWGGFLSVNNCFGWLNSTVTDALFALYGFNGSWNNVVNLTFFNETWVQYGFVQALSNGTWYAFNSNFTNSSTTYWWMVNASINGTQVDSQVFTFTTGSAESLESVQLLNNNQYYSMELFGGSLCSVIAGMIVFILMYKKKKEIVKEDDGRADVVFNP